MNLRNCRDGYLQIKREEFFSQSGKRRAAVLRSRRTSKSDVGMPAAAASKNSPKIF